mgnify:CR=1 FL=1
MLLARVVRSQLMFRVWPLHPVSMGHTALLHAIYHSSELHQSSNLHTLVNAVAFSAREVVIGDGDLWTAEEAVAAADSFTTRFVLVGACFFSRSGLTCMCSARLEATRYGLRFGNDALRLQGSAGRDPGQDSLLYGGLQPSGIIDGLDSDLKAYIRAAIAIVQMYHPTNGTHTPLGANATALALEPSLSALISSVRGPLSDVMDESIDAYHAEFTAEVDSALVFGIISSLLSVCIILLLYFVVLRSLEFTMMGTARRTENMLLVLPETMIRANRNLSRFFTRKTVSLR